MTTKLAAFLGFDLLYSARTSIPLYLTLIGSFIERSFTPSVTSFLGLVSLDVGFAFFVPANDQRQHCLPPPVAFEPFEFFCALRMTASGLGVEKSKREDKGIDWAAES